MTHANRPARPARPATLALASLLALACAPAALPAADATPPHIGLVADPCAGVPVQPTAAHKATADWYAAWTRDWLAQDWAQRCRYRADNAALPPPAPGRVVLMGDSITEGWREQLPAAFGPQRIGRGISGQVTEQMLVRFRDDVLALSPEAVQIMAGTNDIAGNRGPTTLATVEGNIASMAELARAHGIRVLIASVPPADHFGWQPWARPADDIRALNEWLKGYAASQHFTYVDYYAPLADANGGMKAQYTGDGVHPNAAGYAVMQPVLEAALARALAPAGH